MKTREFVTCLGCNSATLKSFINPVRQLCKVCEARELAAEDYSAEDRQSGDEDLDESGSHHDALARMGLGFGHEDLPLRDQIESLPTADTEQVKFDDLRRSRRLPTRDRKAQYKPATVGQFNALKNKLGWSPEDLRSLKLSVADASKLMQAGPRWRSQA